MTDALAGRLLVDLSYDDLALIAQTWIVQTEGGFDSDRVPSDEQRRVVGRVAWLLEHRRLGAFRQVVRPKTPVERAFVELFSLSRVRRSVLAYLSLQEGRHWDGSATEFPHAAKVALQSMLTVGKHPPLSFALRLFGLRIRLRLDPARHLRALYLGMFQGHPKPGLLRSMAAGNRWLQRRAFSIASKLFELIVERLLRALAAHSGDHIERVFRTRTFRRNVAFFILLLFPGAQSLDQRQWANLFGEIAAYFPARLLVLRAVAPPDTLLNHGIMKLIKIAFGVIASRVAARSPEQQDETEFISSTLRLAYSWGITYPLVDNLLDSNEVAGTLKQELVAALESLFAAPEEPRTRPAAPAVAEVVERLTEVISLAPAGRKREVCKCLLVLLEAHRRDSDRKLSRLIGELPNGFEQAVWTDSVLKAAFIRIATMEICGSAVDNSHLASQFVSALVNQLGDDLWDIKEDLSDDRVTPFTLYIKGLGEKDPLHFFLSYCLQITRSESPPRQLAMAIGIQETCRCFLESVDGAGPDLALFALKVERHIAGIHPSGARPDTMAAPHVDLDAVLFSFESAFLRYFNPKVREKYATYTRGPANR